MIIQKEIEAIDKLTGIILDEMYTETRCPVCGNMVKTPTVARQVDIDEISQLKDLLKRFIKKHPEIGEMLLNDMLDLFNKYLRR